MRHSLDVIFEDNHLLVINKPALLPTMGVKQGNESLVTLTKEYLKRKYNKPGNVYLGVVSRLDAFVSGIVVFARTSKSASRLSRQFASCLPEKKYLAIVPSKHCLDWAELDHWLIKDESNHRMMTVDEQNYSGARQALLRYTRIGETDDQSLLEIKLMTGRKHQIRVQMAASGHPVVGDKKYGSKIPFATGIALHSCSLTIEHPTQKKLVSFTKAPPAWWKLGRFQNT